EVARPALPRHVLGREHPRLLDQLLVEMAVGSLERAHEGALLGPALPVLVFLLGLLRIRLVVPDAGIFEDACHVVCSVAGVAGTGSTISRVLVKSIARRG